MIIDDQDSLRKWLTSILHPLCDADPAALAKYVLALIKKDKPEPELKQSMLDQLDVFLQQETHGFVDVLFKALGTKEYLKFTVGSTSPARMDSIAPAADKEPVEEKIMTRTVVLSPNSKDLTVTATQSTVSDAVSLTSAPSQTINHVPKKEDRKKDPKDDESVNSTRDRRKKSRSPRRSRSRSPRERPDRPRRSRSPRDRDRDRGRRDRHGRNKSPPLRRYDRRWLSRSPPARRSSSPPLRNRSRTPPRYNRRGGYHSRSRTRSPVPRNRSRSRSPINRRSPGRKETSSTTPAAPAAPNTTSSDILAAAVSSSDDKSGDKPNSNLQSVVAAVRPSGDSDSSPSQNFTSGVTTSHSLKSGTRCQDFDLRGLCMRGELCPYDHGQDPVVLEDISRDTNGPFGTLMLHHGPTHVPFSGHMLRPGPALPGLGGMSNEYYPDDPSMDAGVGWGGPGGFRPRLGMPMRGRGGGMMRPMMPGYGMMPPRELISVPMVPPPPGMEAHGLDMHGMNPGMMMGMRGRGGRGRGYFDHGRLGKPIRNFANCSLEVRKVPREQNNIMDLHSHFIRFGRIVNIQINFEADQEAALITFSSPAEAHAAYKCADPILNNRFIRVFWHNKEKENQEGGEGSTSESQDEKSEQEKILMGGNGSKLVYNAATAKKGPPVDKEQEVEAIKKNQEELAAQQVSKRINEEKKREHLKLLADVSKRKQDMLTEQIEQQKKLISRVETGKLSADERDKIMMLIKTLQDSIEGIKKDLEDRVSKSKPAQVRRSKEETQREMLDAELDLYQREQEGGDTIALQQKVNELRVQARHMGTALRGRGAASLFRGLPRVFPPRRGRGGISARGGHLPSQLRKVDRRPTQFRVTGFPVEATVDLITHFNQFGTMSFEKDGDDGSTLTIKYDSRKPAEQAYIKGRQFGDQRLSFQWVIAKQEGAMGSGDDDCHKKGGDNGDGGHDDHEAITSIDEDELGDILTNELLQDDEDDEDEEDRSWRR